MNIALRTYSGHCIVRPDTTWERDNEDAFLPEFVDEVSLAPVLFVRVSRAGRSVAAKFAERYYDSIGYGALLYPENLISGSPEGFAEASCLDHTSFLPFPMYNRVTLGREGNIFQLTRNAEPIFECSAHEPSFIEQAIEDITKHIYIRTGDLIAIELAPRKSVCCRGGEQCHIRGSYCENEVIDFKIIL
ncbi:MAG: hypothetical protein KBS55_03935 [Bacteroidales bacterium]|nr:hypothetical protein [Candidatus Cryptobacteroides aphodequi]